MAKVLRLHSANDDAPLYERFAERAITAATSRGLPPVLVAGSLLSKSINVLIDELGADETAQLLDALALRISTALPPGADDAA
ncbi:MAG: hypothetical protein HYX37_01670 [Rhizobiales bacterium]|nr:hypothetical protein [Hyphomicrobiales bacterium]